MLSKISCNCGTHNTVIGRSHITYFCIRARNTDFKMFPMRAHGILLRAGVLSVKSKAHIYAVVIPGEVETDLFSFDRV